MTMRIGLAALLILSFVVHAEDGKPAATEVPGTREKQIEYLEKALAEGIRTRDWKMTGMALKGFKAAGISGTDMELSMLRSEKFAALDSGDPEIRSRIEIWGLVSRGKLGDAAALETVRAMARQKLTPVAMPILNAPEDAKKAFAAYSSARSNRDAALLALALMKEPGVGKQALELLRSSIETSQNMTVTYSPKPLILAVLAADPKEGWQALLDTAESPDLSANAQITLIQTLLDAAQIQNLAHAFAQVSGTADMEIAQSLPKEASVQLWKPLLAAMQRYTPEVDFQKGKVDSNVYTLPSLVSRMLVISKNQQGIAALEEFKTKVTGPNLQYVVKQIESIVEHNKKPVPPPAPPDK